MMAAAIWALELREVRKRFGTVQALDGATLRVKPGTVHAVVGENGAGKSTLMKIAYGQLRADAGEISVGGHLVGRRRYSVATAVERGLGMVHQHFMLVPTLTVAENMVLGHEPRRRGWRIDLRRAAAEIRALAGELGLAVDPAAKISELTVGEQQRVEIVRALYHKARILVLDEPTAVLSPGEVRELFAVLRRLVAAGSTVVVVTHKLDEVIEFADRVTVMRRGTTVANFENTADTPLVAETIAKAMVGRPVLLGDGAAPRHGEISRDTRLHVQDIEVAGHAGRPTVHASFELHAGEVLGIAGVQGNGQSELVLALAGLRPLSAGTVRLDDRDISTFSVGARGSLGMSHIPEDRQERGLVLDFGLRENFVLGQQRVFSRFGIMDGSRMNARATRLISDYDVRPADEHATARGLSGGNQQKVVVARELDRAELRVLLCAQPTRGVDIGAIERIHRSLRDARDAGVAVLLVSAELSELGALADRVLVFYKGRIVGEIAGAALNSKRGLDEVGTLMTGAAASASCPGLAMNSRSAVPS